MNGRELIDLTAVISEDMVMNHPNHPRAPVIWQYQRHVFSQWLFAGRWDPPRTPRLVGLPPEAGQPGKGHGVQSEQVLIGTHMGTHIDSPLHFDHKSTEDIASIPLDQCWGSAVILDLRDACRNSRCVDVDDLDKAETASGERVGEDDVVILHTVTQHVTRMVRRPTQKSGQRR